MGGTLSAKLVKKEQKRRREVGDLDGKQKFLKDDLILI